MSDEPQRRSRRGSNAPGTAQDRPGLVTHGAWSSQVRQRFSDERTLEGKALASVVRGLIADCGPNLNAGQAILLDRIKEKLMVLMKIGEYIDKQISIVSEKGELLPVLRHSYLSYSEALRRDLAAFYEYSKRERRGEDLYDLMRNQLLKGVAK